MKKLVFILLSLCSVQVFAQRIDREIPENALVYALPKTNIEISVEIIKDRYIPGPYVRYAEEQLSVDGVAAREDVNYSIGKISMKPVVEADYEYMYSLPAGDKTIIDASFLMLSSEGLIFSPNEPEAVFVNLASSTPENYQLYPDRIPSSPLETQNEFMIERIKTDSGFISVPFQQSIIEKKDPQSRAEEAAKFLFALRQRRFELVTGDVDHAFSGSSLKDALDVIDRLEEEYLSLFLGKHFVESRTYKFYISPEKALDSRTYPVFHFSKSEGVLSDATRTTAPFTLNIIPSGKVNYAEGVKTKAKIASIYYRIPETVTARLMQGSKEVCSGRMPVYQMGKELVLPSDVKLK
ncbi:MAG: DUF4831 family protein [Prevotellaceae bacterium]|jgi:hypothetical protein|nr:DUF4831 family protein [Prevotellaceae bacterium]